MLGSGACVLVTRTSGCNQWRSNEENQWKIKRKKTSCLENEKFIGTINKIQKNKKFIGYKKGVLSLLLSPLRNTYLYSLPAMSSPSFCL